MTSRTTMHPPYEVGYGKPPEHSRFRKGQSGNPGGRKRGMTMERAKALALKEAYRTVRLQEGDGVVAVPAIQAIMRSQVALAAKGNGPAQRAVIAAVKAIEQELAARDAELARQRGRYSHMDYNEAARRVAFLLDLGGYVWKGDEEEKKDEKKDATPPAAGTAAKA